MWLGSQSFEYFSSSIFEVPGKAHRETAHGGSCRKFWKNPLEGDADGAGNVGVAGLLGHQDKVVLTTDSPLDCREPIRSPGAASLPVRSALPSCSHV